MATDPQRFRSRPQEVEAVQWTGDNIKELWDAFTAEKIYGPFPEDENLFLLAGKDGTQDCVPVPVGHWIVRLPGDDSDYWPVDPDYFASKYEGVVAQSDRAPGTPKGDRLMARAKKTRFTKSGQPVLNTLIEVQWPDDDLWHKAWIVAKAWGHGGNADLRGVVLEFEDGARTGLIEWPDSFVWRPVDE